MARTQRAWRRPELVVLVRHRPEELVLANCKTFETDPGSTATYWLMCSAQDTTACVDCLSSASS